jgi:hypothetical protein
MSIRRAVAWLMPGPGFPDNQYLWAKGNDFDRPSGTGALCIAAQALRAWLLACCPSGTKTFSAPKIQAKRGRFAYISNAQYFPAEHFQGVLSADPLERGAIRGKEFLFN